MSRYGSEMSPFLLRALSNCILVTYVRYMAAPLVRCLTNLQAAVRRIEVTYPPFIFRQHISQMKKTEENEKKRRLYYD